MGSRIKRIKRPIKNASKRLARNSRIFDFVYGSIIRKKRERRYKRFEQLPVDDNLILFESYNGRRYADNPKAIYEYMIDCEDFRDYSFVWCLRGRVKEENIPPTHDARTEIVTWGSDDYYKTYARAKYWIANTRIPEAIKRKEDQFYMQCWHGTPLKKLGIDIEFDNKSKERTTRQVIHNDVSRYSALISPSPEFSEKMTSALDLENLGMKAIIHEIGYPRNDSIVNYTEEDVSRVRDTLGIPEKKRVILYAPTYRDDARKNRYEYKEPLDLDRFFERIPEDVIVLFRTHYFIVQQFDFNRYAGRMIDVSGYPEINDLYIISDMLITDYSSVMFDYSILERPIIYYMYDLEHYRDELRGFYFDISELAGRIATTQEELEAAINTVDEWAGTETAAAERREFRKRFAPLDDGHASARAAFIIMEK